MKKYFIIIPILLVVYILTLNNELELSSDNSSVKVEEDKVEEVKSSNLVAVSYNGQNLNMSIDDYVVGVLSCEMPASFDMEALKAGAVAARTFYMYKQNMSSSYIATNTDQCFINNEVMKEKWGDGFENYYNRIKDAVMETNGEYITYNGNIIESFYFSLSNGYTENIENVFSESMPYLVSVSSTWDKNLSGYEKSVNFKLSEVLNKLGLENSDSLEIKNIEKSSTGRINKLDINGVTFRGTDFRKKLGIRSTDFDIEVVGDTVNITTRGYGHGVGLSQYGANEMAKLGYTYKDILKYYYTGVEISTL